MSKEQEGLIELVGQEYTKWFYDNAAPSVSGKPILNGEGILTRGEFINKCKTDTEFSERWGLKIEERELGLEERSIIAKSNHYEVAQNIKMFVGVDEDHTLHKNLDDNNTPTKLITITYNDKTIMSYE
jgi:hypothetical protein